MHRRATWITAVCLAAASCSSGDRPVEVVAGGAITAVTTTDPADVDGPPSTAAAVESGAHGPDLPGLLDASDEPIPNDAEVRAGVLGNGLRYYIRANDNPGGKADLRLVVRAGSVDETGPSTGVAHFVEHMLFNGTELFPENELIDVLRSFGAAFGADINAYTSFDETVYSLNVPNAPEPLEAGLTVLEQWLSHATFDPDQVIAERGVVLDEWRVRTQSTDGRLFDVAERMYLAGSPYAGRSPIGTADAISDMTEAELRAFYDTWYRPDNAAVVVVGEIDVDDVEDDIERLFGPAVARAGAAPTPVAFEFPLATRPEYGVLADPDQRTVDVEVTLPLPAFDADGTAAWRVQLLDQVVNDMLVRRLGQDIAAGEAPFDRIAPGTNSFVASLDAPALYAFTDAARATETLQALLDEYERADRFGFSAQEVEVAVGALRSGYESLYLGRDSAQDGSYADDYVDHVLTGAPYPSIDDEYRIAVDLLDRITPAAAELRFRARWANSAPHVIISAPAADAERLPGESEVLAMVAALADRPLTRRDDQRALPEALMQPPVPAPPVSTEQLITGGDRFFDPVEITWANGVRVILNTNTIVEGQVYVQAASPGGSSLVDDADVVDALYAADVVTSGGVADFNQAELERILADRDVQLGAWITPYRENFAGSAATADVESLMALLHLYMTQPRFDPVALAQVISRVGPAIDDPSTSPQLAAADALLDVRYPGELRYAALPTPDQFATLDLAGIERVWIDRFGNSADWVFVFSGDFDVDVVAELAGSYLGTLPATGSEIWVDVEDPPPAGIVKASVRAGTGDTAAVSLLFTSPVTAIDAALRVNADVATEVISARLTDVIRERDGESYSPSVASSVTTDPDPVVQTYVSVTGAPDRIETVADLVVAELAELALDGPSEREFDRAFAQVAESYNFVNNGEFLTELLDAAIDPRLALDDYLLEFAELDRVSAGTVQRYLADHVASDRYIETILLPR